MRFWDASAIVPLLIAEPTTETMQAIAGEDPAMLVWWATESSARPLWHDSSATAPSRRQR